MIKKALYSLGIPLIALGYSTACAAKKICIAYVEDREISKKDMNKTFDPKLIDEKSMVPELIQKLCKKPAEKLYISSNGLWSTEDGDIWRFDGEKKDPPEKFNSYTKEEIDSFIKKVENHHSNQKIKESDQGNSEITSFYFTKLKNYWNSDEKVITKFEKGEIKTVDFDEFFREEEPVQPVQPDKEEGNHDNLNPDKEEQPVQSDNSDNGEGSHDDVNPDKDNHDGDATKIQQGLSGKLFSTKSFVIAIGFVVVLGILWKILEPFKKQNKSKSKKAYKQKGPITARSMKGASQN